MWNCDWFLTHSIWIRIQSQFHIYLAIGQTTFTYCSSFGNVLAFLGTMLLCHRFLIAWPSSPMVSHAYWNAVCIEFKSSIAQILRLDRIGSDCSNRVTHI